MLLRHATLFISGHYMVRAETFEIAWRRLEEIPPSPDDLLWLYVTARHVLANSGRRIHPSNELTARLVEALRGADLL